MRDHSLVPRVLRHELPTAFLASTVASSLTFCKHKQILVSCTCGATDWQTGSQACDRDIVCDGHAGWAYVGDCSDLLCNIQQSL